jgi:hypothetical protein
MRIPTKQEKDEQRQKVKVDGIEVKVKTPSPWKVRPVYYCQTCDASFPSQLDLEHHKKIDHNNGEKR